MLRLYIKMYPNNNMFGYGAIHFFSCSIALRWNKDIFMLVRSYEDRRNEDKWYNPNCVIPVKTGIQRW